MKTIIQIVTLMIFTLWGFSASGGGFIIINPPGSKLPPVPGSGSYMLEVKSLKVETSITDLTAYTTVEQVFVNSSSRRLEGWFLFPVPKSSVLSNFSMDIDGVQTPAELLDAEKARKIYENIVRQMKDPALLEYADRGLYKVRIFPIEPNSEKHIKISYREILEKDNNSVLWTLPLNTEKYSAKPLNNIALRVQIQSKQKISSVFSPSHQAEFVQRDAHNAVVGFEQKSVKSNKDFKMFINYADKDFGLSLLTYKEDNDADTDGFFLMNISPAYIDSNHKVMPKDVSFILDVSGSMKGENMEQAKKALTYCVNNLNPNDRFEIVRFSTIASTLFGELKTASSENIKDAEKFIADLQAIGGTNMQEAFELAFESAKKSDRLHTIVFITDGKPTIGTTDTEKLLKQIAELNTINTRIFTFGVGNDINTHLLDKITRQTRAHRTYVAGGEDISHSISGFFDKVSSPVLTDLKLSASGLSIQEVFPRNLPDLFKGSSLTVLGKYQGKGKAKITLTGKLDGKEKSFDYQLTFSGEPEHDFVPVFWASRKIGFLLDQIRLNGEDKELIDEIKQIALKYGIITPYTAYLILEDEKVRIDNGDISLEESVFTRRIGDSRSAAFYKQTRREYNELFVEDGAVSIERSKEVQTQTNAKNYNETMSGAERMNYTDRQGRTQNFARQTKVVQGRAVYQTDNFWIDYSANQKKYREKRIRFADKAYFDLLNKHPEVAGFYAMGRNVKFVFNSTLYIIEE